VSQMTTLLVSLALSAQAHPGWYKAAVMAALISISAYLLARTTRTRLLSLGGLILGTLFVLRLPVLALPEQNPDESFIVSGAITWTYDPVYWRSVDSATHGPGVALTVLLGHAFGLPLSVIGARMVGLIQLTLMLLLFYLGAIRVVSPLAARFALLSMVIALGIMRYGDFVSFNAEHPALLLLWFGIFWLIREYFMEDAGLSPFRSFVLGAILGLVPFVKLQAVPVAGSIAFGWMLIMISAFLGLGAKPKTYQWWPTAAFLIGSILPTVAIVLTLGAAGILSASFDRYIIGNIAHANYLTLSPIQHLERLKSVARLWFFESWVMVLLTSLCAFGAVIFVRESARPAAWPQRWAFIGVFATTLASLYSVARSGSYFPHYCWFLFIPIALLSLPAFEALCVLPKPWRPQEIVALGGRWPAVGPAVMVPALVFTIGAEALYGRFNPAGLVPENSWPLTRVAREVRRHSLDGEPIAVWGHAARVYVLSQRRQGVLLAQLEFQYDPELSSHFLAQLRQSNPPVFVDCVGPGNWLYTDRRHFGHEQFPDLAQWIESRYRLIEDLEGCRVYVKGQMHAS
jgi:hypothetical protein